MIFQIKPISVSYGLGIIDHDSEGRLLTVEFDKFYLICGYIPNSGDGLKRLVLFLYFFIIPVKWLDLPITMSEFSDHWFCFLPGL